MSKSAPIPPHITNGRQAYMNLYFEQSDASKERFNGAINEYFEKFEQFDECYKAFLKGERTHTYDFTEHSFKVLSSPTSVEFGLGNAFRDHLTWRCHRVAERLFDDPHKRDEVKAFLLHKCNINNNISQALSADIAAVTHSGDGKDSSSETQSFNESKDVIHAFLRKTQGGKILPYRSTSDAKRGERGLKALWNKENSKELIDRAIQGYQEGWKEFNEHLQTVSRPMMYNRQTHKWIPNPKGTPVNDEYNISDLDKAKWIHHYWLIKNVLETLFPKEILIRHDVLDWLYQKQFKKSRKDQDADFNKIKNFDDVVDSFTQMLDHLHKPEEAAKKDRPKRMKGEPASKPDATKAKTAAAALEPAQPLKPVPAPAKDEKPFFLWRFFTCIGNGIASLCSWLWAKMPWVNKAAS